MKHTMKTIAGLISLSVMSLPALAQDDYPRTEYENTTYEIQKMLDDGMPKTIGQDNVGLVAAMLEAKTGTPLQESFNSSRAMEYLFGGTNARQSGKCFQNTTCNISAGKAAGQGEYRKLQVKHDNDTSAVRFVNRAPQTGEVVPYEEEDEKAYNIAMDVLVNALGIPEAEIPVAPADAKYRFPVKTINLAMSDGSRNKIIPVEKLVSIQRGLYVDQLGWVPGPGKIKVALNGKGVEAAAITNWSDLSEYGRGLDPYNAKTRQELVEELSMHLEREGIKHVKSARSILAVAAPDGMNAPEPVLSVYVSPQERDLDEDAQANAVSTAGVVINVPLIAKHDESKRSDDD